jgi:DNA invertase Pin-like site-specific DNA recombinase
VRRLLRPLLGAISEFERSLITERVRAGIRNARNKGRTLGRPRLEVDGGRIARLRNSGASLRAISKQLGFPSAAFTVHLRSVPITPSSSPSPSAAKCLITSGRIWAVECSRN